MTDLSTAHNLIRWVDRRAVGRGDTFDEDEGWIWVLPKGLQTEIIDLIKQDARGRKRYAPGGISRLHPEDPVTTGYIFGEAREFVGFEYNGPSDPEEDTTWLHLPLSPLALVRIEEADLWLFTARIPWVPMSFRYVQALSDTGLYEIKSRTITTANMPNTRDLDYMHAVYSNKLWVQSRRRDEADDVESFSFPGQGTILLGAIEYARVEEPWLSTRFTISVKPDGTAQALGVDGDDESVAPILSAEQFATLLAPKMNPLAIMADSFLSLL